MRKSRLTALKCPRAGSRSATPTQSCCCCSSAAALCLLQTSLRSLLLPGRAAPGQQQQPGGVNSCWERLGEPEAKELPTAGICWGTAEERGAGAAAAAGPREQGSHPGRMELSIPVRSCKPQRCPHAACGWVNPHFWGSWGTDNAQRSGKVKIPPGKQHCPKAEVRGIDSLQTCRLGLSRAGTVLRVPHSWSAPGPWGL